jgi:DNA replication protein DnaC
MSWGTCRCRQRPPRRSSRVVQRRYLKGSIILTTNLGIARWGQIFDDPMLAAAMLDRLLQRSIVLRIE